MPDCERPRANDEGADAKPGDPFERPEHKTFGAGGRSKPADDCTQNSQRRPADTSQNAGLPVAPPCSGIRKHILVRCELNEFQRSELDGPASRQHQVDDELLGRRTALPIEEREHEGAPLGRFLETSHRTLSSDKREKLCKAVSADFYLLNEADAGVCRSGYRSAEELAMRLNLNIAQAMECFEVRANIVGLKDGEPGCGVSEVNPQLARNEQFNVLLSRYPIRYARRIELKACHDWYADERALGGQLRRGTRSALIAEVDIPGSDPGTIVMVVTHLENKSFLPTCRNEQFLQINAALQKMTEERGGKELPVITGGDMNSVFGSEFFFMKPYQEVRI